MANREGKYARITPLLPKFQGVDPDRRDVLEAVKVEILTSVEPLADADTLLSELGQMDEDFQRVLDVEKRAIAGKRYASEFARVYTELRYLKDKLGEWASNTNLLLEAYESLMVEQMEVEGVSSQRLKDGSSVAIHDEPYPQVTNKEEYRQWCVKQGLEREMHLWPSTTAKLVKDMLLAGNSEPPGITVYSETKVRLNKAK